MNWIIIIITAFLIFLTIILYHSIGNRKNSVSLLGKNIKELNKCLNMSLFKNETIYVSYERYEEQIRFERTKNNLLSKCNQVSSIICDMVNLYSVDNKISKFYNEQINSLNNLISDIEQQLTELSKVNDCKDYKLSEIGKLAFIRLNNKLNKHITSFIIGNAKFFTSLKFINSKDKNKNLTMEEYLKAEKKGKLLKYLLSLAVSVLIGILTNYISVLIGL